jgi:hypothetical protein
MRWPLLLGAGLSLLLTLATGCSSTSEASDDEATGEGELVGGKADLRWSASGYLVRGTDTAKVACGATLIAPNVVVTAGHCVTDESKALAFGTGDPKSSTLVKVKERHVHPQYRADDFLRRFDVAYLVLESDVTNVRPAALPAAKPSVGCNIQAIGYGDGKRKSTPACVLFRLNLGGDPIFEVHPAERSALCIADGDEGSPVVERDADRQVLVGIFVGSITGGFTDCRRGTQFLDGYEQAFGYRAFLEAGIESAKARR